MKPCIFYEFGVAESKSGVRKNVSIQLAAITGIFSLFTKNISINQISQNISGLNGTKQSPNEEYCDVIECYCIILESVSWFRR